MASANSRKLGIPLIIIAGFLAIAVAIATAGQLFANTSTFWPRIGGLVLIVSAVTSVVVNSRSWRESLSLYCIAMLALQHGVSELTHATLGRNTSYRIDIGVTDEQSAYATLLAGLALTAFAFGHFFITRRSTPTRHSQPGARTVLKNIDGRLVVGWYVTGVLYHLGFTDILGGIPPIAYGLKIISVFLWPHLLILGLLKLLSLHEENSISFSALVTYGSVFLLGAGIAADSRLEILIALVTVFILSNKWRLFRFRLRHAAVAVLFLIFAFSTVAGLRAAMGRVADQTSPEQQIERITEGFSKMNTSDRVQNDLRALLLRDVAYRFDGNATLGVLQTTRSTYMAGLYLEPIEVGLTQTVPSAIWPQKWDLPVSKREIAANVARHFPLPHKDLRLTVVTIGYAIGGIWFMLAGLFSFGLLTGFIDYFTRKDLSIFIFSITLCFAAAIGHGTIKPLFYILKFVPFLALVLWSLSALNNPKTQNP